MSIFKNLTNKDKELLANAGVHIEDREYSKNELSHFGVKIEEYIMSHSTKNGDISRVSQQYEKLLDLLGRNWKINSNL